MRPAITIIGGALAAIAASSCCILPLLLGAASAGSLGLSASLAPYRPLLIAITICTLAAGFYMAYRPRRACAGASCCAGQPDRKQAVNRIILWCVSLLSIASIAYSEASSRRAGRELARIQDTMGAPASIAADRVDYALPGLSCSECALTIAQALKKTPGIVTAHFNVARKSVAISYDRAITSPSRIRSAIERLGFAASPARATSALH